MIFLYEMLTHILLLLLFLSYSGGDRIINAKLNLTKKFSQPISVAMFDINAIMDIIKYVFLMEH